MIDRPFYKRRLYDGSVFLVDIILEGLQSLHSRPLTRVIEQLGPLSPRGTSCYPRSHAEYLLHVLGRFILLLLVDI